MSSAEELLNTLTDDEIAAYSAGAVEEPHIIIGNDRFITVPESLKRIAVQYDHDVETVTFDCPRYWDNTDLSTIPIYINYMLPDGNKASYIAQNVRAEENIIHFDWTISANVTQIKGNLCFLVCAKSTDDQGNEKLHWNSELCNDCYISEGMEAEESIELEYPDIITQLLERMLVVEGINVAKEYIDSQVASANEAAEYANDAKNTASDILADVEGNAAEIRNSYTNALKGTVSGEVVRINDVSPLEHDVKCVVHGKNLFDISKIANTSIATNNGNGSITIAANNYYCRLNQKLSEVCPYLKPGDVVTLSFVSDSTATQYMYFHGLQGTWSSGTTIKMTQEILDSYITIYGYAEGNSGYGQACIISNIQIEKGVSVTDYESYIDPATVEVTRYGKNLFPVTPGSTNFGITLSKLGNYYVLNGTPTTSGLFITKIGYLPAGTYTVSANNPKHNDLGKLSVPIVQLYSPTTLSSVAAIDDKVNSESTATIKAGDNYEVRIRYQENVTYSNFIIKPQLEFGSTATEYEPYVEKDTVIPGTDGNCIIESTNPNMTLLVNKPGATVEAEYNRDLKKAFSNVGGGSANAVLTFVTLYANNWVTVENEVFSQVVNIPGITDRSQVNINLTLEQNIIFRKKDITLFAGNKNGTVTVYCVGQKPANDYTIQTSTIEVIINE